MLSLAPFHHDRCRIARSALPHVRANILHYCVDSESRFLLVRLDLRAGLVSDAVLAAICIEHGLDIVSANSDFARFPEIGWINPVA